MRLIAAFARLIRFGQPCTAPRAVAVAPAGTDRAPAAQGADAVAASVAAGDGDAPCGCGWFDSSWCLRQGLQVTELASLPELQDELPLGWWLAWQTGAGAAVSPAPARTSVASRRRAH